MPKPLSLDTQSGAQDHGEDDALVRAKAAAVQGAGLLAIICIGETLEERKSGKTLDVLGRQLAGSVPDGSHSENTVVAYEPVWAIGTGMTPTTDDIGEAHQFLRKQLIETLLEIKEHKCAFSTGVPSNPPMQAS